MPFPALTQEMRSWLCICVIASAAFLNDCSIHDSKMRFILIHITDARRRDCIGSIRRDFAATSRGWSGAVS
jgi:hypothetical protein